MTIPHWVIMAIGIIVNLWMLFFIITAVGAIDTAMRRGGTVTITWTAIVGISAFVFYWSYIALG